MTGDFFGTGKFPSIPKLRPNQKVSIHEQGEFKGKESVIQSFSQSRSLALIKFSDSEAIAQIPLEKLSTQKMLPQVKGDKSYTDVIDAQD